VPDDVVGGLDAAGVERVRHMSGERDLRARRGVHVSLAVRDVPVVRYLDAARLQFAGDDLRGSDGYSTSTRVPNRSKVTATIPGLRRKRD